MELKFTSHPLSAGMSLIHKWIAVAPWLRSPQAASQPATEECAANESLAGNGGAVHRKIGDMAVFGFGAVSK